MTPDEFNTISDAIMLPILQNLAPAKRKKLLLVLRKTVHPRAYAWIDAQLESLNPKPNLSKINRAVTT